MTRHDDTGCSRAALSLHIKTMRWAPDFGGPEPDTGSHHEPYATAVVFELLLVRQKQAQLVVLILVDFDGAGL